MVMHPDKDAQIETLSNADHADAKIAVVVMYVEPPVIGRVVLSLFAENAHQELGRFSARTSILGRLICFASCPI
jgi:hypothetical protein